MYINDIKDLHLVDCIEIDAINKKIAYLDDVCINKADEGETYQLQIFYQDVTLIPHNIMSADPDNIKMDVNDIVNNELFNKITELANKNHEYILNIYDSDIKITNDEINDAEKILNKIRIAANLIQLETKNGKPNWAIVDFDTINILYKYLATNSTCINDINWLEQQLFNKTGLQFYISMKLTDSIIVGKKSNESNSGLHFIYNKTLNYIDDGMHNILYYNLAEIGNNAYSYFYPIHIEK